MHTHRKISFLFIIVIFLAIPPASILKADSNSAVIFERTITIVDEGFEYTVKNSSETIKGILEGAGIELYEQDIIFPSTDAIFRPGTKIIIKRAIPLVLDVRGSIKKVYTQNGRVSKILAENNIEVLGDEFINVDLNQSIFPGMEIKIWKKPKPKPKIETAPEPKIVRTGRVQIGIASWYKWKNGNFCASTFFKKGTRLLVTNLQNNRQVIVIVNDRGPFSEKIIDLEKSVFSKLSFLSKGVIKVKVEELK